MPFCTMMKTWMLFFRRLWLQRLMILLGAEELVALALEVGKYGVDGMALLDKANTETYGNPEITKVNIGVRNNPAILVSGHGFERPGNAAGTDSGELA